jgi:DNA-binding XRE family transcriptional regulator
MVLFFQHMARPSKLTPETAHTAEVLARLGFTDEKLAAALGISRSTLHEWRKANPEFTERLKGAKSAADSQVIDGLFRRACGFTADDGTYFPPHPVAAIFWLKNRAPAEWRDTSRQEVTGADGAPLQGPPLIELPPAQEAALSRLIADAQARVFQQHLSHIP